MKLLNILTIIIILIIIILSYLFFDYFNSYNDYINKISNFKTFVYSIAWEDFKIDSKYLNISETDNILMITTGGCNILNTLLLNPNNIISCDLSPSQNALLDLKMSAIKNLNYNDFWQLFGLGKHDNFDYLYNNILKKSLKLYSSIDFWNKNLNILFTKGLYKSGKICEPINFLKVLYKKKLEKLCNFTNIDEQYDYYLKNIKPILFNKKTKMFAKKNSIRICRSS